MGLELSNGRKEDCCSRDRLVNRSRSWESIGIVPPYILSASCALAEATLKLRHSEVPCSTSLFVGFPAATYVRMRVGRALTFLHVLVVGTRQILPWRESKRLPSISGSEDLLNHY
jgi:hypothetical protein